jgi:hypothetical protein
MGRLHAFDPTWGRLNEALKRKVLEIAESAVLGWLEPEPLTGCYADELARAGSGIGRAESGRLARYRKTVNRNAFLIACLDYTSARREEHLIVGYGFRHGSTTKVTSVHHVVGGSQAVSIPPVVAHAMWDHFNRERGNELLVFHNHPYQPLSLLANHHPLPSAADRQQLAALALNPHQLLRSVLGEGRVLFYLGENNQVKQFRLPSVLTG